MLIEHILSVVSRDIPLSLLLLISMIFKEMNNTWTKHNTCFFLRRPIPSGLSVSGGLRGLPQPLASVHSLQSQLAESTLVPCLRNTQKFTNTPTIWNLCCKKRVGLVGYHHLVYIYVMTWYVYIVLYCLVANTRFTSIGHTNMLGKIQFIKFHIPWRIHVTGRFTYMKTIKIN